MFATKSPNHDDQKLKLKALKQELQKNQIKMDVIKRRKEQINNYYN
jgi:hypothetical protein